MPRRTTAKGSLGKYGSGGIDREEDALLADRRKPAVVTAGRDRHLTTVQGTPAMDLIAHLYRQRAFSRATFGPGMRTKGVSDHIRKELKEIEAKPADLYEWVDVILLALDGAWRCGATPEQIAVAIERKQSRNEDRDWPDWRTQIPDKAIEHVRSKIDTKVPTLDAQDRGNF